MFNVHIQSKLLAHACHRLRYRPSPVPLSRTGKNNGGGSKGGQSALAGTREYKQSTFHPKSPLTETPTRWLLNDTQSIPCVMECVT